MTEKTCVLSRILKVGESVSLEGGRICITAVLVPHEHRAGGGRATVRLEMFESVVVDKPAHVISAKPFRPTSVA